MPRNVNLGNGRFAMFNKERDISAQLGYLLEGIDWRMPQHTWRPQAAG